ncbi:hypothetical protein [Methanosarcina sp.]
MEEELQNKKLRAIVRHAYNNTEFFTVYGLRVRPVLSDRKLKI